MVTYNHNRFDLAEKFWGDMITKYKIIPAPNSYTTMIELYSRNAEFLKVIELFDFMLAKDVPLYPKSVVTVTGFLAQRDILLSHTLEIRKWVERKDPNSPLTLKVFLLYLLYFYLS